MLALGRVTVTITSKESGKHLTFRLRCADKDRNGKTVPFDEASHVYFEDYDGELVARFYPRGGVLYFEDGTSPPARWSVQALLRHLAGDFASLEKQAEVMAADLCGRCGQPLTDPSSIERGFGPDCFGMPTVSRHVAVWDQAAA